MRWAWLRMVVHSALFGLLAYSIASTVCDSAARPSLRLIAGLAAGAIVAALAMQVQMQLARLTMRAQIMNLSRGERVPVCLKCGYDQSGNITDRCPECGAPIRVAIDGEPLRR